MEVKTLIQINFLLLALSSCGGSSPSKIEVLSAEIIAPQPLFNEIPIKLIDGVSYYSHACNDPSFQFLLPMNINDDEYVDFIAHFWCDSSTPAQFDDQPTQDALVAYVSSGNGSYAIDNIGVFGSVQAKLGGASRKYSRGDINDDGKDDFAFAMNWEDGRASFDNAAMITNYARPSILMSNESGYEIIRIGKPDWGHSVQIKENKIFFAGHSSQAFEFYDSKWIDISEQYPDLSFASFLLYDNYIINSVRKNGLQGLELLESGVVISSIMHEESFKVNFESWNDNGTGNYRQQGIYNIRGKNYFGGMTSEMCRQDNTIIATINASKLISGEIIENGFYSETETVPVTIFAFYEIVNKTLVEKSTQITGEEIDHTFNFFDCEDVNYDNKKDIVAQVFSQQWNTQENNKGVPEIYINNGNSYVNLDTTAFPTYSINDDSQGYMYDVDLNGTIDLVMFPLKANVSADIEIYISNRSITD